MAHGHRRRQRLRRPARLGQPSNANAVEVWKDPSCGCCRDWIDHMRASGFRSPCTNRQRRRAPSWSLPSLEAHATALVGGYLLEGHVPAADVPSCSRKSPKALGLTVPACPWAARHGRPQYKGRKDAYDVLLVTRT